MLATECSPPIAVKALTASQAAANLPVKDEQADAIVMAMHTIL